MKSKIIFFLLFVAFAAINISCSKKFDENLRDKHIIPDVPVYTVIDLGIGGEGSNWAQQSKYYSYSSEGKPLGYEGHGILIYTDDNTEYKCWDATCTNCESLTSAFTQENLKGEIAECPVCHTCFSLRYGTPFDSEKKIYPLKEYFITKRVNKLIVTY